MASLAILMADDPKPGYDLEWWRQRIPLFAANTIPMNACSHAPQTSVTRAAAERYLEGWNRRGMDWDGWMEEVTQAKRAFAKLISASADEIAVFSSVSEATSAVASALDFGAKRKKIVVTEAEFPTIGHVWLAQERRGARVAWVPLHNGAIEIDDYDRAIDDDTLLVSACHGYYQNGFTQDLAAIAAKAHAKGALVYADAYQTLGTTPVNVKAIGVDFLASGCLKFLMGIPGIAFLYVKKELIKTLHPAVTGWFGRANPFGFEVKKLDWAKTASRFDTGTPPVLNAYVARAGIEIVAGVGAGKIKAWHDVLSQRLIEGGHERGLMIHGTADVAHKTATTGFVVPDAHGVEARMRAQGVIASARGPVIRLSPHFYNSIDDVDRALDVLSVVAIPA